MVFLFVDCVGAGDLNAASPLGMAARSKFRGYFGEALDSIERRLRI
jgi:hypothetical protein